MTQMIDTFILKWYHSCVEINERAEYLGVVA